MKKNAALKFAASALAVGALPFVVTRAVNSPPDMSKLVAAAVNFTASPAFAETEDIGNGNLILYKPSPEGTEETLTHSGKIVPKKEAEERENYDQAQTSSDQSESEETSAEPEMPTETTSESDLEETVSAESISELISDSTSESVSESAWDLSPDSTSETVSETISVQTPESSPEMDFTGKSYIITQNISEQKEDLSVFNSRDLQVEHMTFESNNGANFLWLNEGGQVRNCTELDNDFLKEQMNIPTDIKIEAYSDQPQVLIMHTHACESYLTGDGSFQDETYTCRTADASQSVVAVGRKIAEKLAENGICVLHDGTLHDYPSYNGSYDRAEETITDILAAYPSIKVVLDIHRDGIVEEDGTPIAAVNEINGKKAAQVMIISAASDGYYYVPNYLENFHFACLLQQYMEKENNGITRPILFEYCQYNQHLTTGSLLIEVGSQGNTLEQALYSGELIGGSIARALLSLSE